MSKPMDNDPSSSNLCLTAARAVTCDSNEPPNTTSRVSTRSSKVMSQDPGEAPNLNTPVNKIRGLVKTLAPRKRQTSKTEDNPNTETPTEQASVKSPSRQNMTLIKSLKRKRTTSTLNLSTSPKKLRNEKQPSEDPNVSTSCNLSPLFPVLKLRRTAGTTNNYVALLSEKNGSSYEQNDLKSNPNSGAAQESSIEDSNAHPHNTRFKGKKRTGRNSDESDNSTKINAINEEDIPLQNGETLVQVYTKRPSTPTSPSTFEENPKGKHSNVNKAYAKRGVQPRHHDQAMRVGEVVWGKVHGHPWWPGRIMGILCHASENDAGFVKVAWYGSTTTSDISCSFLVTFQEHFKQLFKKQKQGAYRRAVREAQQDLQVMSVGEQVLPVWQWIMWCMLWTLGVP